MWFTLCERSVVNELGSVVDTNGRLVTQDIGYA
jgi:hypothetical protein